MMYKRFAVILFIILFIDHEKGTGHVAGFIRLNVFLLFGSFTLKVIFGYMLGACSD